jgi:hypothetical protein
VSNATRCYEALNNLADGSLHSWDVGSYRRHLPQAGAIVEIQIIDDTHLRASDYSDDEDSSTRVDVVEYQVNHQTKEAEPIFKWTASKVINGERVKYKNNLERLVMWLEKETTLGNEVVKKITSQQPDILETTLTIH